MKRFSWLTPLLLVTACSSDPDAVVSTGADAGAANDSGDAGASQGATCSAARAQLLTPVDSVSTGEVTILSNAAGVTTIFVDASAGGTAGASTNPRVYLNLETATKVDVGDTAAASSTAWDLAIKRPILFTNSGDGGPGQGGALFVTKSFDDVAAADGSAATLAPETFFEADCTAKVDATNAVKTSFDGWYDYDTSTNALSPRAGTWLVKGATGKLYKVAVLSYYATPDGGVGQAGGRYTLKVGAL